MTDVAFPKKNYRKLVAHLARLASQPSAWRGLVLFLTGMGIILDPALAAHISAVGMAVAGLIGMLVDDSGD